MKNLLFILIVCCSLNGFGQNKISLNQFKKFLNDTIQKALTYPDEEFIISIKKDNQFIAHIGPCNEINRDSINQGCVMTELFFDLKIKEDVQLLGQFKLTSLSKEYTYLYADMEMYYKSHGNNYTSCTEDVIKIMFDLFGVKEYSNIIIKLKSAEELK